MSQKLQVEPNVSLHSVPEPLPPLERTCPIDLRSLPPVARATEDQIRSAVARARRAQEDWGRRSFDERAAAVKRAARGLLVRRHEVLPLVRDEIGKLEIEGLINEAVGPLDTVNQWIAVLRPALRRRRAGMNPIAFAGKRAYIDLVPRGVIGILAPWNFPVAGLYRSVFPALLTGNAVVVKPSEYAPRTSQWFLDAVAAAVPAGLVEVVHGDADQGQLLIDAGVDACVFTGSTESGRAVRLRCAERGIPSSIEMGGKDAAIVLADCDLGRTAAGITQWALNNVGQACGGIEIVYAERRVADALVARLGPAWNRLRAVPGPDADISPIGNRRQFEVVQDHVADAVAKGAQVVCGGAATGQGLFFRPTVLDHCTEEMKVVRDETFGPVLAVVRVDGADDAIRRVNSSRYGLSTSIWTRDLKRAEKLAGELEVGVACINNHAFTGAMPALPWSGTRETGFGVANSVHSLPTFVRPRALLVDRSRAPEPYWLPYDRSLRAFGDMLSELQLFHLWRAWRVPLTIRSRVRTIKRFFGA